MKTLKMEDSNKEWKKNQKEKKKKKLCLKERVIIEYLIIFKVFFLFFAIQVCIQLLFNFFFFFIEIDSPIREVKIKTSKSDGTGDNALWFMLREIASCIFCILIRKSRIIEVQNISIIFLQWAKIQLIMNLQT